MPFAPHAQVVPRIEGPDFEAGRTRGRSKEPGVARDGAFDDVWVVGSARFSEAAVTEIVGSLTAAGDASILVVRLAAILSSDLGIR